MYAGIDAGSRAIKIVVLDGAGRVVASACGEQTSQPGPAAAELYRRLLDRHGIDAGDVAGVVATGYARACVAGASTTITEISCHAAGVHHLLPAARTVVEIGGQDSKLLRLGQGGSVRDFAMNDRCAAGTGRFLELVAARLDCPLGKLGALAAASRAPAPISSMCAVFAETEIIGLLAGGTAAGDIVAGVQGAVASRIAAMAGGQVDPPVALTGGVAMIAGMDKALARALGHPVTVVDNPQFTGALGAALLARRQE